MSPRAKSRHPFSGWAAAALALALLAGATAGCGDRRLILKVDVLSFLDSSETSGHYGPVPAGTSGSLQLVQDRQVNLLSGIEGVVEVEAVEIFARGVFDNQTGTGDATLIVLFGRPGEAPLDSVRVMVQLEPGVSDTVDAAFTGDAELARLFSEDEIRVSMRLVLDAAPPPGNSESIEGEFRLTRLLTVLTARREGTGS